jgi:dimethylaniline monooxygenase (N-oxide forming)
VLIGIGNSALDISLDLVGHAASVTVCSNGTHLVPVLDETTGMPLDYNLLSFEFHLLSGFEKLAYLMRVGEPLTRKFVEKGMPSCTNGRLSILKNGKRYVAALEAGKILLKCAVKSTHGSKLVLNDGSVICADVVLLCTGFKMDFSFLAPEMSPLVPGAFEQDYCALYKHVVHPELPCLFFVGYFDTFHNQVAVSEMQA